MFNPYVALGCLVGAIALFLGGAGLGMKYEKGQAAREEVLIEKAATASREAAAVEIGKIQIKHTTIRQNAKEIMSEKTVYRECEHDPVLLRLLNAALVNGSVADDRKLPDADADGGQ